MSRGIGEQCNEMQAILVRRRPLNENIDFRSRNSSWTRKKSHLLPHRGVEGGHFGHEVEAALALLFLELEGNAAHRACLDALHQVGSEAGNLVAHALGRHHRHIAHHALVGVEVEGQARVVLLHDEARVALDSLGADAPE